MLGWYWACPCRVFVNELVAVACVGPAGDLRHGEEHRAAEEVDPGQAGPDAGGSHASGHPYSPTQRGAVPRPRAAQVSVLTYIQTH